MLNATETKTANHSLAIDPADVDSLLEKEWLLCNSRGSYSSSTVIGCNTRRYHGLLVAAFQPPVGCPVSDFGRNSGGNFHGLTFLVRPADARDYGRQVFITHFLPAARREAAHSPIPQFPNPLIPHFPHQRGRIGLEKALKSFS